MQVRNLKPIVMSMAVDFLKREGSNITTLLTRQHHVVIKNFLEHKRRNEKMIAEREVILKHWKQTESLLALKGPVHEAEFAIEEKSPLVLYDCLIPTLRENRRFYP